MPELFPISYPRISTTEETFQSHIIDSTIFQTNSFVWICIACFLYNMFSLICCTVKCIRKDIPTKTLKYLFHSNNFENDSECFWTEEPLLLIVMPDQHGAIACISSVSQFNILEANKVMGLVVLNKNHRPFSFMSPPNSIALLLPQIIIYTPVSIRQL